KPAIIADPDAAGYLRSYRRIVMYGDLNSAGSIFGGRLVAWIDEATAIYASCQMNARRIVTAKISELIFNQPAKLGDMLEICCKVMRRGRTSITISTVVTRRSFADDPVNSDTVINSYVLKPESEICRCELVFVCVDEHGRPRIWNPDAT
ncbi:MAG: acyl-CoA thioesterase, partial [Bdellovibrionota bacterium]